MNVVLKTNLTCGSCVRKISAGLDHHPSVNRWTTDLEDPRKLVHIDLDDENAVPGILAGIKDAGFDAEVITGEIQVTQLPVHSTPGSATPSIGEPTKPSFRLATYRPLLLVVTYIAGLTIFCERLSGDWNGQRAMAHFMGFFFLGFAFFKLLNVQKFADAFATYDVVAKRSRYYALAYPFLEVSLGILFLSRSFLWAGSLVTAGLMAVGLVGVISAVRQKQAIQCACLGTAFQLPMSFVTIIENSVMLGMAIVMML